MQFFRDPFNMADWAETFQVGQISYHDERVVEILYRAINNRPVIQDKGQWFELRSPDVDDLSIFNVLEALGYSNDIFVITWPQDSNISHNILVREAPLFQATLYPIDVPVPNVHYEGPLPQQVPNNDPPPQEPIVNPLENPEAEMAGVQWRLY
jgi:hypothetical protein